MALEPLGWLARLDRITTVSGGSLMAGILATHWDEMGLDPVSGKGAHFETQVVKPTLRFTDRPIDAVVIAVGLVPFVNPATVMDWILHFTLTRPRPLDKVPAVPRFVVNSANLATEVTWRFSPQYMGDSKIGVVCAPDLRLSPGDCRQRRLPALRRAADSGPGQDEGAEGP